MGHVHEAQEVYRLLNFVRHIAQSLEYVLHYRVIPEKSEGPLQHDGYTVLQLVPYGFPVPESPEVHPLGLALTAASCARDPFEWQIQIAALGTVADMIEHLALIGPVLICSPYHVYEHALTCRALPYEPEDLACGQRGADIIQYDSAFEFLSDVLYFQKVY
ncbi:hypothetical protein SDC9_172433 [bioreactor metagenome]|uniref:Uncharacterized protein n=1 Tax=bioreactor metagenome TaxID=1076179 RepID=A0A645GFT7_9ZZZZ